MVHVINQERNSSADLYRTTGAEIHQFIIELSFQQRCVSQPPRWKGIPRNALYFLHEYRDKTRIITQNTSLISMCFVILAIFTFQIFLLSNQDLVEEYDEEHMNTNGSVSKWLHCRFNQMNFRKSVLWTRSAHFPFSNSPSCTYHGYNPNNSSSLVHGGKTRTKRALRLWSLSSKIWPQFNQSQKWRSNQSAFHPSMTMLSQRPREQDKKVIVPHFRNRLLGSFTKWNIACTKFHQQYIKNEKHLMPGLYFLIIHQNVFACLPLAFSDVPDKSHQSPEFYHTNKSWT